MKKLAGTVTVEPVRTSQEKRRPSGTVNVGLGSTSNEGIVPVASDYVIPEAGEELYTAEPASAEPASAEPAPAESSEIPVATDEQQDKVDTFAVGPDGAGGFNAARRTSSNGYLSKRQIIQLKAEKKQSEKLISRLQIENKRLASQVIINHHINVM